jgi:hypothetical protein
MKVCERNGHTGNGRRPRAVSTASNGAGPEAPAGGREANGKFAKGNRCAAGCGNPHARAMGAMRAELLQAVGTGGIRRIAAALIKNLERGDLDAGRVLLKYCVGGVLPTVDPHLLDSDELSKAQARARAADVLDVNTISPAVGTVLVKTPQRLALQIVVASPTGQLVGLGGWDKVFAELNDPESTAWWREQVEARLAEATAAGRARAKEPGRD